MTPRGRVFRMPFISRITVQRNRHRLFVFGDNMLRAGYGGQAREMRGEPNTVGIPVKWRPSWVGDAFFTDAVMENEVVQNAWREAFMRIYDHLALGNDVVIPAAGVGGFRGDLMTRAPKVHWHLASEIARLTGHFGAPIEEF